MSKFTGTLESDERGGEQDRANGAKGQDGLRWRIADITIPDAMTACGKRVIDIAASIAEIGQLQPILITRKGILIAGLHRLRAREHLGHEEIEVKIIDLDDARTRLAAIDENLIRKDLEALERAELIRERKDLYEALHPEAARPQGGRTKKNGEMTTPFSEVTANLAGCDRRTVQQDVQIATAIPPDVRDRIRQTPVASNKQELLKLARHDQETQRKLADKLAEGSNHLYEAERALRMDEALERAKSLPADIPNCQVHACSCENLLAKIDAGSVDLILADPPYGEKELIPCCDELARLAAHALRPNGSLLVMVGQMYAHAAEDVFEEYLFNRWRIVYLMRHGGSPVVPTVQRRVNSSYKPILWVTRPDYDGPVHGDVIEGGPKTKLAHEWEQDVEGAARIIELFSYAGELVVDPFVCTGTTGVAALRLGRRFVGCDVDEEAATSARVRLSDVIAVDPAA